MKLSLKHQREMRVHFINTQVEIIMSELTCIIITDISHLNFNLRHKITAERIYHTLNAVIGGS